MANILIYTGLTVMLLGAIYGFIIAVKGYRQTDWNNVRRISYWGNFQHGNTSPRMRRLIWIWVAAMVLGFLLVAIGMSVL